MDLKADGRAERYVLPLLGVPWKTSIMTASLSLVPSSANHVVLEPYTDGILPVHDTVLTKAVHNP